MDDRASDPADRISAYSDESAAWNAARLLVVDDEENIATIVSELLRNERYEVDTSLTGTDAIERIKAIEYDLVLVDLHMEGIDGLTVLDEVQRRSPLTTTIVITGFATLESAISAMRRGAYDYLIKPCTVEDIKLRIRRGLERRFAMLAERESKAMLQRINSELEARVRESTSELLQANTDLKQANRAKDVFFATLSHELRTPLTPILGWARLLRSAPQEETFIGRGLEVIERNADLLNNLIGDLLDASRVISGKFQFNLEPTDLALVVRGVVDGVRDKCAACGLELHCDVPSVPITVNGNRLRLHQIVSNLLSNAIKFTESGGRVSVSVRLDEGQARITVSDTGVGIDPAFLPKVFDLFARASQPGLKKYEGLGVGLAIVRRLTEFQGGTVRAESQGHDQGSTFVVEFACIQQSSFETEPRRGRATDQGRTEALAAGFDEHVAKPIKPDTL